MIISQKKQQVFSAKPVKAVAYAVLKNLYIAMFARMDLRCRKCEMTRNMVIA
jgi:hypothetical protein